MIDTGLERLARRVRGAMLAAAAGTACLTGAGGALAQNDVIIGARESGSTFYVVGAALADVVAAHTDLTGRVLTAAGAAVWMPMMDSREADLGVISHYESWLGWTGGGTFQKPYDVRTVVVGSGINVGLYVRADSDIRTRADLAGRRIASDYSGSPAIAVYAEAEIANAGLGWDDVDAVPRASLYAGQREDATEGRLDAFYASVGSGLTRELDSTIGIRFLGLDPSDAAVARMRDVYPALVTEVQPGAPGVEVPMTLTYLPTYIIAHADVPDDVVYQVVEAVWELNDRFRAANDRLRGWTTDKFATAEVTVPYHEGAVRFFKDRGEWTDAMQASQDALLNQ